MLHYPQLSSGTVAQYPLRRISHTRTLVNVLPDGSTLRIADPEASEYRWELHYASLSDTERSALEDFFIQACGRLNTFTFVDPTGNALRWSENPNANPWAMDGPVAGNVTELLHDGARILRFTNAGQTSQGIEQRISAPGRITWCLSARVRSDNPSLVSCKLWNSDGSVEALWTAVPEWTQIWCSGSIPGDTPLVHARFSFGAGATVEICGMQLQAQPMPGSYRKTTATSGVFPFTRFDSDGVAFRANNGNDHALVVYLRTRNRGQ